MGFSPCLLATSISWDAPPNRPWSFFREIPRLIFRTLRPFARDIGCGYDNNWLVVWNFYIFPYIGNNHPNWLVFFRGVQTTNQIIFQFFIRFHSAGSCPNWTRAQASEMLGENGIFDGGIYVTRIQVLYVYIYISIYWFKIIYIYYILQVPVCIINI